MRYVLVHCTSTEVRTSTSAGVICQWWWLTLPNPFSIFPAGVLETQEAPFILWDTPGWSDSDNDYARLKLGYILDGNVPNCFDLNSQRISPQHPSFIEKPEQADKVHCVCIVIPCNFSDDIEKYRHRVRDVKECAKDRGEPPYGPFGHIEWF